MQASTAARRVNTIQNCLIHDLPCRIDGVADRSPPLFKLNGDSVMLDLFDNTFAITQSSYLQDGDPFGELVKVRQAPRQRGQCDLLAGRRWLSRASAGRLLGAYRRRCQTAWDDALEAWWDGFPGTDSTGIRRRHDQRRAFDRVGRLHRRRDLPGHDRVHDGLAGSHFPVAPCPASVIYRKSRISLNAEQ